MDITIHISTFQSNEQQQQKMPKHDGRKKKDAKRKKNRTNRKTKEK